MEHNRCAVLSYDKTVADLCSDVLLQAGYDRPQHSEDLGVAALGAYAPSVLIIDFDHMRSDKLESVRQLRFVLPNCAIAILSSDLKGVWARRCHMAGADGVLSSSAGTHRMLVGLRIAIRTGCYTDPDFVAVPNEE
ncbi:MAG: response regulator [Vulcanimicrobiaceae bacterium]